MFNNKIVCYLLNWDNKENLLAHNLFINSSLNFDDEKIKENISTINNNNFKDLYKDTFELKNYDIKTSIKRCAEEIFRYLNSDDRPNRYNQRSLSVGDIIQINEDFYFCCYEGFKKLTNLK